VVRVNGLDAGNWYSEADLATYFFQDASCLRTQVLSCSSSLLDFQPATISGVNNGVYSLNLNMNVSFSCCCQSQQGYISLDSSWLTMSDHDCGTKVTTVDTRELEAPILRAVADRFLGTSFNWDFGNTSFAPGVFDKIIFCMPIAPFVGTQADTAVRPT
jgi:hypothetical protein